MAEELQRLELLVPEAARLSDADLPVYTLAFIEHYQGDTPQLEGEWDLLFAALAQSWQCADYATVVRLVAGMARPAGRLCSVAEAEHLLHLGIEASRRVQDHLHQARFFNRLGGLLFSRGRYWQGRQIWSASLRLAATADSPMGLWEPLASFAHIADILGSYTYAEQFVDALLSARGIDDPDSLAVATFIRGFYARLMHELDDAREDFRCALRLLSTYAACSASSPDRQLFTLVVQAELARVEGHYERAKEFSEAAYSLARVYSDPYTAAVLLFDQGLYAYQQSQCADIVSLYTRLRDIAQELHAPHVYALCRFLGQQLPCALHSHTDCTEYKRLPLRREKQTLPLTGELYESLSERELDVLLLVSEGLSNHDIARRLVITRGTVKKHLEHIYSKLRVHNRTSAIARAKKLEMLYPS